MTQGRKEKVGIWMHPSMIKQVDAAYPLHEISSRSEFVCKAVEFYLGFLQTENSTEYIHKTTLAFLENQLAKLTMAQEHQKGYPPLHRNWCLGRI